MNLSDSDKLLILNELLRRTLSSFVHTNDVNLRGEQAKPIRFTLKYPNTITFVSPNSL